MQRRSARLLSSGYYRPNGYNDGDGVSPWYVDYKETPVRTIKKKVKSPQLRSPAKLNVPSKNQGTYMGNDSVRSMEHWACRAMVTLYWWLVTAWYSITSSCSLWAVFSRNLWRGLRVPNKLTSAFLVMLLTILAHDIWYRGPWIKFSASDNATPGSPQGAVGLPSMSALREEIYGHLRETEARWMEDRKEATQREERWLEENRRKWEEVKVLRERMVGGRTKDSALLYRFSLHMLENDLNLLKRSMTNGNINNPIWLGQQVAAIEQKISDLRQQVEFQRVLNAKDVQRIVDRSLSLYKADGTGMADYALESAGASVIDSRCSQTYRTRSTYYSLFGVPLFYHSESPRTVIQPEVYPGKCWPFQGNQGTLGISLSYPIHITHVSLEHLPRTLSPTGKINSAPRVFTVYGITSEEDKKGTLLGTFNYDQNGEPLQTFKLQDRVEMVYWAVELRILSNWGHPDYTCVYRFRVHGQLSLG